MNFCKTQEAGPGEFPMKQKHGRGKATLDSKCNRSFKEQLRRANLPTLRYLCLLL